VGDENGIFSTQINNDGSKAAIGLGSGSIQLFSLPELQRIRKLHAGSFIGLPVTSIKFHPVPVKELCYTAGADGSISVWDIKALTVSDSVDEPGNQIGALDLSNDGLSFATAGKDKDVRLYDSGTLQLKKTYFGALSRDIESDEVASSENGHSQKILALRFHPEDKDVFLTAGWDHCVKMWDIRTDGVVRTIRGPFVCGDGLDILSDEILTGSWLARNSLKIWDYKSGRLIEDIPFPVSDHQGEFLYCARFLDENTIVAGGSGSNDVKVIDRKSRELLGELAGANHCVQALDVAQKTRKILLGTSGNVIKCATVSNNN